MANSIMFVDDETQILKTLRRLFSESAYEMVFFESGEEGLAYLEHSTVDMIISDIRMPGMDGFEFLKRVKMLHPKIIRIALSGYTDSRAIYKSLEENITKTYIFKPWDSQEFVTHIDKVFQMEEALRSKRIMELINNFDTVPSIPSLYLKIKQMVEKEESVEVIAKTIEKDQASSSKILRIANSAFYGAKTGSISQAIMYIGLSNVKSIILSSTLFKAEGKYAEYIEQMWENATLTNRLTNQLYQKIYGKRIPDVYASAGLLHNIGMGTFISNYTKTYGEVLEKCDAENKDLLELEHEVLGITHQEMGGYLLEWWDFPLAIVEAAMYHHTPLNENVINKELLCLIHIANHYSWRNMEKDRSMTAEVEACCEVLNTTLENLENYVAEIYSQMKD